MANTLLQSASHRIRGSKHRRVIAKLLNPKFTLSIGAQALVSGFHFLLNLALLQILDRYDYGLFAFAFVLGMFALAINNALISTPLTVYTPVIKNLEERQNQEQMLGTANLLFFAGLCLMGVIYTLSSNMSPMTAIGATFFIAMYAARHFSRSSGYARLKPLVTASGDLVYVLCGSIIIFTVVQTSEEPTVGGVLIGLGLANLFAIFAERFQLHGLSGFRFKLSLLSTYSVIWEQSRWALAGALTTLFMGQAHSLIITGTYGPTAFAPLAAGFVMFGPVRVALMTWQNLVKPEIAVALSENRLTQVQTQIRQSVLLMAVAVVVMSILLYLCWPWIHQILYAKKYSDQPMGLIVSLWAMITMFAAISNAPSAALQALRDFRVLALASVYGAIISAVTVSAILFMFAPEYTLVGILLAELFVASFLIIVISGKLREKA